MVISLLHAILGAAQRAAQVPSKHPYMTRGKGVAREQARQGPDRPWERRINNPWVILTHWLEKI